MAKVSVKKHIDQDVMTVWNYVSKWDGTSRWIPGVGPVTTEGLGIGATRCAELAPETGFPGMIIERLDALNQEKFSFAYSTVGQSPLPVTNYSAEMKVEASGKGALVTWNSTWEPSGMPEEELQKAFEELYSISLDNVERELLKN